ncbi:semaphorin-1A-like, partial [Saccoglossus kowalevskii]|uniref:Semaphorin-5A-like n=1 Tax=Saccoglossus kowalevskii TaxID=10224 RepID=A0ABM0MKR9_SACKO
MAARFLYTVLLPQVAEYVVVDPCDGDTSCQSYIKVLLEIPPSNDDLLVCGSTTVISKYDCYNVSSSNSLTTSIDPEYICSVHYLENTTAVIDTDDGKLYTALVYNGVRDRTIGRAPSYIEPVDIFSVAADEWIGEEPSFISSYTETVLEDWVLFFFREVALESETRDIYSRMAKVCKDDNGGNSNVLTNNWATYQKARLQCENKYYYNVLLDTALSADGQTIYAAFIANENGVPRPAVCSYDLTQAVPVFENQQYYSQDTNTDQWEKVVTSHDPYPGE